MAETDLYLPVKRFLEHLGFEVKGEINGCDVVGIGPGDEPVLVVCELKLRFSLDLLLQATDRAAICDEVWLAAGVSARAGRERDARFRALCRRLGFGLLGVRPDGQVEVLLSPAAPPPRRDPRRRSRLVDEHRRRQGDPVAGGGSRQPIMTAYRQEALRCARALLAGPIRLRELRQGGAPNAAKIVRGNVYGWFRRVERGTYALTDKGREAALASGGAARAAPPEPTAAPAQKLLEPMAARG